MAYYFKHDDNARRDAKLIRLRRVKGMKGIGIYWCLIEIIHEQEGIIKMEEINSIAFELQEDENNILSVIKEFDLFVIHENEISNTRVCDSLNERVKNSKRGTNAVNVRWDKERAKNQQVNTNVLPKTYVSNTIREEKIKEYNIDFNVFWNLYDKKISKHLCELKWKKLKDEEREKIIKTLPSFLKSIKDKQFLPHPLTYINQKRWNDEQPKEIEITEQRKKVINDSFYGLTN